MKIAIGIAIVAAIVALAVYFGMKNGKATFADAGTPNTLKPSGAEGPTLGDVINNRLGVKS